jgi:formamidopyrimidine-DNA glycosylase
VRGPRLPELPEVENTRRGLAPYVRRRRIAALRVYEPRLRWRVARDLPRKVAGERIVRLGRRGKYLLLGLESGTLLLHLGMSGNLRAVPAASARILHDHFDLVLDSGTALRFNDPRRFGSLLYSGTNPQQHPLLAHLGPEPLSTAFDADYLLRITRGRRVAIKHLLMNSRLVVGVGNIYASEALFRARIRPQRRSGKLSRAECAALVRGVRAVLRQAIRAGGTTLRDYLGADGTPGYFRQRLYVYERAGKPCRRCGTPVRALTQGQRSTYYCPSCQK